MKRTALIIGIVSLFVLPTVVLAEVNVNVSNGESTSEVNVQSESSGTSTVCQNGKCTTSNGENSSTVCVNGKCTTSGEDVDYKSEDGNTRIRINNNSTNVQVGPTDTDGTPFPTKPQPAITVDPEIEKEIEEAQKESEVIQERVKQRIKEQESALDAFIKAELESLQKFIDGLFN